MEKKMAYPKENDDFSNTEEWFNKNTFDSKNYENIPELIKLKQGKTISLCLPTLNEDKTIENIIKQSLLLSTVDMPLIDEIVLIDSGSEDRTRGIARAYNIPVHLHTDILPKYGTFNGKGEALWKSLHVLKGDIIVWVDTDTQNFHPRFIYGLLGPLLREQRLLYCKGFYRRSLQAGDQLLMTGGGRVTELMVRPLINLFFPELSGFAQPLSGEYAIKREAVEMMPIFTGYSVEIGLLIDLVARFGLNSIAQVNLQRRIHRNRDLESLSIMSFAIAQVMIQRLAKQNKLALIEDINQSLTLVRYTEAESIEFERMDIQDKERPPIINIPEYLTERQFLR